MANIYNAPNASPSSVGTQLRTDYYHKKALVEAVKDSYFGQMANSMAMPKNMGKTIKQYHYMPLLDDRNINDQGIDAAGASTVNEVSIIVDLVNVGTNGNLDMIFVGNGVDADAAVVDAGTKLEEWAERSVVAGGLGKTITATVTNAASVAAVITEIEALAEVTSITGGTAADAVNGSGNLYGSSKDIGYITGKMPSLTENGGRVNRVGMKRITLEGSINKFGLFEEYTKEAMDFDSDSELLSHLTTELVRGANEITEDQLQMSLLNSAGVLRFTGGATQVGELTGDSGSEDVIEYDDLVKLSIELDNNRCPKNTKIISGSRMVDTKVVNAARYIYIGSELIPSIMKMTDYHNNKAFIPVAQYASAGNVARGEIGAVDNFRFIVVPEMMKWSGVGASVGTNGGYYESAGKYDVFPMLVVGDGSFTTIGFQTDGKTTKFKTKHVRPESDTSYSFDDPFGEKGFYSIKWYYGFMALRPERIALVKTVAEY